MRVSPEPPEQLWHVTVLSNFIGGYDKYARTYSKAGIAESRFPDRFFLLRPGELDVGVARATRLLHKLALPGDRLLALATVVPADALKANIETGLGRYVESPTILLDGVAYVDGTDHTHRLLRIPLEEAAAQSLRIRSRDLIPYSELIPRSFSILPIAKGCQASCPFCFSEASVSCEQEQAQTDLNHVRKFARAARVRGATRFVITGGGEPGLVRPALLEQMIRVGRQELGKVVLITNGHHLATHPPAAIIKSLQDYANAGLSILAVSRHHYDDAVSERLMSLRTNVAAIANAWRGERTNWPELKLRFTCVLQLGGVDGVNAVEDYVDWATALGVEEICFKELYVSTSVESVYHRHASNTWSHAHQVPLSVVAQFAALHRFVEVDKLPWGSPIFAGTWQGRALQIAAYTEPSLFWERTHGIARSWNLMSDGRCLGSLEDRASQIGLPDAA
jgi:pyruvate-formate lyase-activating enzyme